MTAVKAPPTASVRGSSPATRSATTIASHDEDQADEEADGARGPGIQAPEQRRPERPADVACDLPAEDDQHDRVAICTGVVRRPNSCSR